MTRNATPDVAGNLQDAGSSAGRLSLSLMNGEIPDFAAPGDDIIMVRACQDFRNALVLYEKACSGIGDDDRDLGPSQEQRL